MKLLTVDLEKKLVNTRKATISRALVIQQEQEGLLGEANKLLQNSTEEDVNYLRRIGFNSAVRANEDVISGIAETKRVINSLNTNPRIFTTNEIKTVCVQYGLRFLDTDLYKGSLPADLAIHIKDALEVNKDNYRTKSRGYREISAPDLMIAAPKESFNLQARPVDPLLFLKLNNGNYYLVHKWGDDLSVFRYVTNLVRRNDWTAALSMWFFIFSIIGGIISFFHGPFLLILFVGFVVSTVITIATASEGFGKFRMNDENWDSEFKD